MTRTRPEHLWKRYLLAVALIAMAITVSHFVATNRSGLSSEIAADVNMSGRQRMLSQRITLFTLQYGLSDSQRDRIELGQVLERDLALFLDSHEELRSRSYLSDDHLALYTGTGQGSGINAMTVEFTRLVSFLSLGADSAEISIQARQDLHALATGPLLTALDASVQNFEDAVRAVDSRSMRVANATFALALLLLALEAAFIFWPAHLAILRATERLRDKAKLAEENYQLALKASEEREQAFNAKNQFFNMLSLELRNPLNAIVAGLDIMRGSKLSPDDQQTLELVAGAGDDLTEKINRLLQHSSQNASEDSISLGALSDLSIDSLYQSLTEITEKEASAKGLRLDTSPVTDGSKRFRGPFNLLLAGAKTASLILTSYAEDGQISVHLLSSPGKENNVIIVTLEAWTSGLPLALLKDLNPKDHDRASSLASLQDGLALEFSLAQSRISEVGEILSFNRSSSGKHRATIKLPVTALQSDADA